MSITAIENLQQAFVRAMSTRPKVGGFPYLAEALRQAGVIKNTWQLPSCQSTYHTTLGVVINQGQPLVTGSIDVPAWNQADLITALRKDQAGESEFSEFIVSTWQSGVVSYLVDFEARTCTYFGANGESYLEEYLAVDLPAENETLTAEPYELV